MLHLGGSGGRLRRFPFGGIDRPLKPLSGGFTPIGEETHDARMTKWTIHANARERKLGDEKGRNKGKGGQGGE